MRTTWTLYDEIRCLIQNEEFEKVAVLVFGEVCDDEKEKDEDEKK